MSGRAFLFVLVAFALFGSGYSSLAVSWLTPGPIVATYNDAQGPGVITLDRNMTRPAWVVLPHDASVISGGLVVSAAHPQGFGSVDATTHGTLDELRALYLRELKRNGFEAVDLGVAPLNPATATFLGIAGSIIGEREATKDCITVQIRTAEGLLLPSRVLQINWYKTDAKFQMPRDHVCLGAARAVQAAAR